jgi:hypothetical protein
MEKIHALHHESDDTILNDLRDLVWSEAIDMQVLKLDVHCGFTIQNNVKEYIIELILDNKKLSAVKYLKDCTRGCEKFKDNLGGAMGLKDAKEYVDIYFFKCL